MQCMLITKTLDKEWPTHTHHHPVPLGLVEYFNNMPKLHSISFEMSDGEVLTYVRTDYHESV